MAEGKLVRWPSRFNRRRREREHGQCHGQRH
jgi:hypothetical protein